MIYLYENCEILIERFKKMKRVIKVILSILQFLLISIIAIVFWIGVIFGPMYCGTKNDKEDKEDIFLHQDQHKNIELKELMVGIPWRKELDRRSTTIGGINGNVNFILGYDTIDYTIEEIRFSKLSHSRNHRNELDTLPIQKMINDIEHTFNIEFMKAPKNCDIELFTIRDSVEFNCSYSKSFFVFSMIHRPD